jgi:hypothetical protein
MDDLFPSSSEIKEALTVFLYGNGGSMEAASTYEPLAEHFDLSDEARTINRGDYYRGKPHPQLAWHNKVQYGRFDLKKANFLDLSAPTGTWRLNDAGMTFARSIISENPNLSALAAWAMQNSRRGPSDTDIADPPSLAAVEGEVHEELTRRRKRSPHLRKARLLMDEFTCQSCGFSVSDTPLAAYGSVVEVHHVNPLSDTEITETTLVDLVTLCPTCHRVSHVLAKSRNRSIAIDVDFLIAEGWSKGAGIQQPGPNVA